MDARDESPAGGSRREIPLGTTRRQTLRLLGRLLTGGARRLDAPDRLRVAAAAGPLVRLPVGPREIYLLSDPDTVHEVLTQTGRVYGYGAARPGRQADLDGFHPLSLLLGQGLLTSGVALHRTQRRLLQPLFHRERIVGYADAFAELADELADRWDAAPGGAVGAGGAVRDVRGDLNELTLAIIARTVFAVELDGELVDAVRRVLRTNETGALPGPALDLIGRYLPLPAARRRRAAVADLHRLVLDLVTLRRAAGSGGADLASLLLAAVDAETGATMPLEQVRDEALTILIAGHVTTANALSWALHLLARHPHAQDRVGEELQRVLGGRRPGAADLPNLPWTVGAFREALRLYPPAWVISRRLVAPGTLCGHELPAGAVLLMSPYVLHRDPQWWPEPDAFRPERWIQPDSHHRHAFTPFGAGPRQCIGNTFAEMEGVIILATLLRRRRVIEPPGGSNPRVLPQVTLRPAAVPLVLGPREPAAASV